MGGQEQQQPEPEPNGIITAEQVMEMFVEGLGRTGTRTHDDGETWANSYARFCMRTMEEAGQPFYRAHVAAKVVGHCSLLSIQPPTWLVELAEQDQAAAGKYSPHSVMHPSII
eukprot:SAG11_NODE_151_length_14583_cov_21.306200_7_plen_113_part_00